MFATRASQPNRRKMKTGGQWPRGKAPAGKHWCVRSGWIDYDPPSPHGVNIDHTVVGTTPGGTLHQVVYKTLGDEAAAHEDPCKRQRRLGTERQRRSTAKRTLASCLQGDGGCDLCKQRKQDASLEEQSAQELQLEAALAVAHLPGDQAQLRLDYVAAQLAQPPPPPPPPADYAAAQVAQPRPARKPPQRPMFLGIGGSRAAAERYAAQGDDREPEARRLAELEELLSHDEFEPVPGREALWRELMDLTSPSWEGQPRADEFQRLRFHPPLRRNNMRRGWQPPFGAGMGGLRTPLTVQADIVQLSYGWLRGSNAHGWLQGCYARDRRPYVEPAWPGLDPPNPRQSRLVDGVYVRAFEQPLTALGFRAAAAEGLGIFEMASASARGFQIFFYLRSKPNGGFMGICYVTPRRAHDWHMLMGQARRCTRRVWTSALRRTAGVREHGVRASPGPGDVPAVRC